MQEQDHKQLLQPDHYHKNKIDVIGYLEQHFPGHPSATVSEGFMIGNVIKYVSRYKSKNGLDDLIKARNYLNMLIDIESKKTEEQKAMQEIQGDLITSGQISLDQVKGMISK